MDSETDIDVVAKAFAEDEFSGDEKLYRKHLDGLLGVRVGPGQVDPFYDLIEQLLEQAQECQTPVLSDEHKADLLRRVRRDWSDDMPPYLRASIANIVGYLIPFPGAREWLLDTATSATPEVAATLRRAAVERSEPIV